MASAGVRTRGIFWRALKLSHTLCSSEFNRCKLSCNQRTSSERDAPGDRASSLFSTGLNALESWRQRSMKTGDLLSLGSQERLRAKSQALERKASSSDAISPDDSKRRSIFALIISR